MCAREMRASQRNKEAEGSKILHDMSHMAERTGDPIFGCKWKRVVTTVTWRGVEHGIKGDVLDVLRHAHAGTLLARIDVELKKESEFVQFVLL